MKKLLITSRNKAKLAFEMLEQEMEILNFEEMGIAVGGIQRDANGNIGSIMIRHVVL